MKFWLLTLKLERISLFLNYVIILSFYLKYFYELSSKRVDLEGLIFVGTCEIKYYGFK